MGFSYDNLVIFRVTVTHISFLFQFLFFQGISKRHYFIIIITIALNGQDVSGFQHHYLRSLFFSFRIKAVNCNEAVRFEIIQRDTILMRQ